MYKKWILGILVLTFVVVLQPVSILAADKPVSDCLNDDEDCIEDTKDIETDEEDTKNASNTLLDDTAEPSLGLNIVKRVFALLLILALIYTLLWFFRRRRSYEKAVSLETMEGI